MIATDSAKAKWQVNPGFLKAIDSLTEKNKLIPGPDLYAYFSKHPEELSDGVHPNTTGALSLIRLWAEKMDVLYTGGTAAAPGLLVKGHTLLRTISIKSNTYFNTITAHRSGMLTVHSFSGRLLKKTVLGQNESYKIEKAGINAIIRFSSEAGVESVMISNRL